MEIEDLIGGYVRLRRQGSNLTGLCPFHSEKSPSFTVFVGSQSYYCFGCHAGGDAINFVRAMEHLDYVDAVKFLADRAGMTVPQEEGSRRAPPSAPTSWSSTRRRRAGFTSSCAKRRRRCAICRAGGFPKRPSCTLAWATRPRGGTTCCVIWSKRATPCRCEARGTCRRQPERQVLRLFQGPHHVPHHRRAGDVVGFGGRVLDDSKPKYLNSPDTPVFKRAAACFRCATPRARARGS